MDTAIRQVRRVGDFPFPHQAAFLLDNPIHRKFANPAGVAERLALRGSERVLEIGPGPGAFSAEIAQRLPSGHLDLFDVQPEMLKKVKRKLDRAGYRTVGFHSGDASNGLPFPDNTFDVAFLSSVIGEVPDKTACIQSLRKVLKPGGRLVFHEIFLDPDRLGIPELRALAEPEGFTFASAAGSRWRDIVEFTRTETA
ncbi:MULTISPECIES: class I SAM-dependent methyltransferase [unclassified Mycobacteroides]|uniref:class I SAM-dependent methyltransferase n=1 Tax=unclassified Mycobacteroides TaxID=2618759 RepID=UPI001321F65A|nr:MULTISPECIES: class I SAM-dependent methyltransferase [unclassified Mycobacteroides]MUM17154.1 ubiquinone biosynthesis methyltransferase UbiE [Mycobacteroides sp. CBMA 326]